MSARATRAPDLADAARLTLSPIGSVLPPPGPVSAVPAAGSGEAAALSIQLFMSLRNHLATAARLRKLAVDPEPAVLAAGATLAEPKFYACEGKPLAVVFDIDGTVLQPDGSGPVVGAVGAIKAARRADIAVVFNADRLVAATQATLAELEAAGLGTAEPGTTLWLRAPADPPGKDGRRRQIARRYCVVAQVGDELGDFSDLIDREAAALGATRRDAVIAPEIAQFWGAGWFMLPGGSGSVAGFVKESD